MSRRATDPHAELIDAARKVRAHARAPCSRVGAAVLDQQGRIHVGCNVENASYGLTVCARAQRHGRRGGGGGRAADGGGGGDRQQAASHPCGACRQVLAELALPTAPVLLAGTRGRARQSYTVAGLLPAAVVL